MCSNSKENMPPAIVLIPCEVDIKKYSNIDFIEMKDKMIRDELSECGNFNTALNVISAFKYQYDPDLYEFLISLYAFSRRKDIKNKDLLYRSRDLKSKLQYSPRRRY